MKVVLDSLGRYRRARGDASVRVLRLQEGSWEPVEAHLVPDGLIPVYCAAVRLMSQ